jgi:hypothetical protein
MEPLAAQPPMLSAPLLAGLFAVPIATASLFLPATDRTGRAEERWRWIGRLTLTRVSGTLLIAAAALALRDPTYYGDAWAALGPALLDGSITPYREDGNS